MYVIKNYMRREGLAKAFDQVLICNKVGKNVSLGVIRRNTELTYLSVNSTYANFVI